MFKSVLFVKDTLPQKTSLDSLPSFQLLLPYRSPFFHSQPSTKSGGWPSLSPSIHKSGSQTAHFYFLHAFVFQICIAGQWSTGMSTAGGTETEPQCNLPSDGENFSNSYILSDYHTLWAKMETCPLSHTENKSLDVAHVSWHPLVATYINRSSSCKNSLQEFKLWKLFIEESEPWVADWDG